MADQRFVSTHLEFPRRALYRERREDAIRSCGSRTDVLIRRDPMVPMGAIVLLDPAAGNPCDLGYVVVAGSVTH